ncbi:MULTISPECIES: hypothetical protein [unclassified Saccharibacter]|uniref:hypothetical protein n=1 Tax=unclassified Saccharibacter TaxID=2648722 RepID=UPI00132C0FA0|nr:MULTISPECIES: hypothetical protein [unclassified Saccharibacter]MXV36051.1 hypothetical protein [Saccharibacter sp. EH611]MXV56910.1 hypothetical protein [Saccharibacter sp. EH70]MXV66730.1 hypothetical protein [Saccharibacter sp. EH60]
MTMVFPRMNALVSGAVAAMLVSSPALAREMPAKPVGHVSFETHSADLGVGYTWGEGKLTYGHHTYRFKIKGGNAVSLGYSSLKAEGEVYNLKHLRDFDGAYGAVTAEATMSKGVGASLLKNSNGVRLKLTSKATGARLAAGLQGVNFEIEN